MILQIAFGIILGVLILRLLSLIFTKEFWIFSGIIIILFIISLSLISSLSKPQVSTIISPVSDISYPLPNCINPTINNPCGTFDTNIYPLTVQSIATGTLVGY